ncbi:MAG TPA: zinc-binding dehydrogenase [Candidatus Binatia bacterium]|nr:zinc-binding dehydrogenase [Candidatus Binatia bacterium]
MRGLVFDPRPPRLLAAGALSRVSPVAALTRVGPLALRELPDPVPPSPDWLQLAPLFTGLCGSDVTQATLQADWDNPLSGLVSFPHVVGHEVVARVLSAADGRIDTGEPVVVSPWLGCPGRGLAPCPSCADGLLPLCAHAGEAIPGVEGSGIHIGNIRGLPGGMGTRMVAHRSQLHRLPEGLEARAGVLADPLAVGIHAAQRALERLEGPGLDPVLVLGAGTIGLATAAALRRLGTARVMVSTAWPYQPALVDCLGGEPISSRPEVVLARVAEATSGRFSRPWRGLRWLIAGGAVAVVDAVGTAATAELALAAVRPGGTVVRVGVGRARRSQGTLCYFKEVSVVGSNGYRPGDLDTAISMLAEREVPWEIWLTHQFPLERWREAFRIAAQPQRHAAVKVSLTITEPGT